MKKKVILVILSIIVILGIIIGFKVYKDLKIENELKKELIELNKLVNNDSLNNIEKAKDKLNNYISKDDYLKVEKAYKSYLLDVINASLEVNEIINDKSIGNVLTIDNIKNDGPDFIETNKYLENTTNNINNKFTTLISLFNEDKVLSYLDTSNLNNYYLKFYKKISFNNNTDKTFKETINNLENTKNRLNNTINIYKETIDFLKLNKDNYSIKNDLIYFNSTNLLNEYNELISKLS